MEVVALDVETANSARSSVCAIAIARFDESKSRSWLLRPEPGHFDAINMRIHGIKPQAVAHAPSFGEVWPDIHRELEGRLVIAHSAAFDTSALLAACSAAGVSGPSCTVACSLQLAKAVWPDRSTYSLRKLAEHLGIDLVHHDAASDAAAALLVVNHAMRELGVTNLETVLDSHKVPRRVLREGRIVLPSLPGGEPPAAIDVADYCGKRFAFTGTMLSLIRREAEQLVTSLGGRVTNSISKKLNFLVVGDGGGAGAKLEKAQKLIEGGAPLRLLAEAEFLRVLRALSSDAVEDGS